MGNIDLSWSIKRTEKLHQHLRSQVRSKWMEVEIPSYFTPEWVVFGQGYYKIHAFRSQIENFVAAINGDEQLLVHR